MHAVTVTILATALLALTALPSGVFIEVLPAAALLLAGGVALVLARGSPEPPSPRPRHAAAVVLTATAALGLIFLSAVPLPLDFTALFHGSARYEQNVRVAKVTREAVEQGLLPPGSDAGSFALTRNKSGTLRVFFLVSLMLSAATLMSTLPPGRRVVVLRIVLLAAVVIAAAGMVSLRRVSQESRLWWVFPLPFEALPGPVACFTNRNHFAGTLIMTLPVALGLLFRDLRLRRWPAAASDVLAAATLAGGATLSLSRGALAGLAAGLLAMLGCYAAARRPGAALGLLAAMAAVAGAVLLFRDAAVMERIGTLRGISTDPSYTYRTQAWRDSVRIWKDYPLLGVGANAFRTVYPQYRTTTRGSEMSHLENEYLQLLVDGGAVGLLALAAILLAASRAAAALGSDAFPRADATDALAIGAGACGAAAAHALFDFALHIPLCAAVFAVTAAAALPGLAPHGRAVRPAHALHLLCVLAAAWLWTPHLRLDSPPGLAQASTADKVRALTWAPTYWYAWYSLGTDIMGLRTAPAREMGLRCATEATRLDPNNYRLWHSVGFFRLRQNDRDGAREAFARVRELRDWVWVPEIPEARP